MVGFIYVIRPVANLCAYSVFLQAARGLTALTSLQLQDLLPDR